MVHVATHKVSSEESLMCVGCREEWAYMRKCVENEGFHIATNPSREFVVPCFCHRLNCNKAPHFVICMVDDKGVIRAW